MTSLHVHRLGKHLTNKQSEKIWQLCNWSMNFHSVNADNASFGGGLQCTAIIILYHKITCSRNNGYQCLYQVYIRYCLMLIATGSFSPERGLPVNFCFDFKHFQSIVMSTLVHSKTLECSFLNNFRLLFHMLRKFNIFKSSLGIRCLKIIKMYRKLDRKSPFTYAATWWSSTSESCECGR